MPRYAELIYNGFWFSPERLALQAAIDTTQQYVTGTVRCKLYKVGEGTGGGGLCGGAQWEDGAVGECSWLGKGRVQGEGEGERARGKGGGEGEGSTASCSRWGMGRREGQDRGNVGWLT
jgi:hypothetical protein